MCTYVKRTEREDICDQRRRNVFKLGKAQYKVIDYYKKLLHITLTQTKICSGNKSFLDDLGVVKNTVLVCSILQYKKFQLQKTFQYFHLLNLFEDQRYLLKEFLLLKEMILELFIFFEKNIKN